MRVGELRTTVGRLGGVSERRRDGLLDWRYHGRLVARQLDDRGSFIFGKAGWKHLRQSGRRDQLRRIGLKPAFADHELEKCF